MYSYAEESNPLVASIGLQPNSSISLQLNTMVLTQTGENLDIKIYSDGIDEIYGDVIRNESNKVTIVPYINAPSVTYSFKRYQYGGANDRFYEKFKANNPSLSDDFIRRIITRGNKETDDIIININYDDLSSDTLALKFVKAYPYETYSLKEDKETWAGWCPSQDFCIVEVYRKLLDANSAEEEHSTPNASVVESTGSANPKGGDPKVYQFVSGKFNDWKFVLGVILLTIVSILCVINFIRINIVTRRVNLMDETLRKFSSEINLNRIDVKKLIQQNISNIKSPNPAEEIKKDDVYNIINHPDVQLFIQNLVVKQFEDYMRSRTNISPALQDNNTPIVQNQPELKTTKIDYQADNNCFVLSDNSSNKIFELYSLKGEYYYTIVNDSSIRQEMLGFVTAFTGYVETRQDSPIPSRVEVIRDGHLIKNGDMFIIDRSCLLQVSLR